MTANQYRALVTRLGFTIASAGRFLEISPRTGRRYAETGPDKVAAKFLQLLDALNMSPAQVEEMLRRRRDLLRRQQELGNIERFRRPS